MGLLNTRLKRFDDAERVYRKATQLAPQRSEAYRALAHLYLHTNQKPQQARSLASKAVELEPIAPNYYVLSLACQHNADRTGALSAIEQAIELEPGNAKYQRMHERIQQKK